MPNQALEVTTGQLEGESKLQKPILLFYKLFKDARGVYRIDDVVFITITSSVPKMQVIGKYIY